MGKNISDDVYTVVFFRQTISPGIRGFSTVQLTGNIAQMKEFLDSGHLQHHVEHHESKHGKKVDIPGHIPAVKDTPNAS